MYVVMVDQNMVQKEKKNNLKIFFSKNLFFKFQIHTYLRSFLLQKFTKILTVGGNKKKAENLILLYLFFLKQKYRKQPPVFSFIRILNIAKPSIEFALKRVGKKMHEIPVPIRPHRQYLRSLRWLKTCLKKKKKQTWFY